MSAAVATNPGRNTISSVQSAKSINYNVFSPVAVSALPRDDEVTMNMYNGDDKVDDITIIPKVAKTEPKVTRMESGSKAGSFVMNAAQVQPKTMMNGGVNHANKVETTTVTKTIESKGLKTTTETTKTVQTSSGQQGSESVTRSDSSSNKANTGTKIKKVGSFQMKSAHSGVEIPMNTTKAMDNTEFKSNLQRTLERKATGVISSVETNEVALKGNANSKLVAPNMSSSSHYAINNNADSGLTGPKRHTLQSDNSHLVTHYSGITSGGGEITSANFQHSQAIGHSEKSKSGAKTDLSGTVAPKNTSISSNNIKSTLSNVGHNTYSYSSVNANITGAPTKRESVEIVKGTGNYRSDTVNSQTSSKNVTKDGSYTKSSSVTTVKSESKRPSSGQITEPIQAQRTHSEIKYSVGNNKQNLNRSDNSVSVNAGARSSYAFDDVTERSSEQVGELRSHGDVSGNTTLQSGQYIAYNLETKPDNSKQKDIRSSNISEWSYHSEAGKISRPDSLLFNSEEYKSKIGKQLADNLPTTSERLEERKTVISPGRVQAQTVQFENRDSVKSPISPAALEAQEAVRSGIVGKLSVELKHLPLTGRSLDAATLEKKKQAASTSSEGQTTQKKKPKFLVEGIDYPAPEKPEENTKPELRLPANESVIQSRNSLVSSDTDAESTTLQRTEKKGFAYLKDKAITSEVLKKAETVTAKKPHEAVEVRTLDNQLRAKSPEESQHLIEARSHLHHIRSKRPSIPDTATEHAPNPLQFALKKNLLGEIQKSVNKEEAASSGQGYSTSVGDPDIPFINEKVEIATETKVKTETSLKNPVYEHHLPRPEEKSESEAVIVKKEIVDNEKELAESDKGVAGVVTRTTNREFNSLENEDGITSFITKEDHYSDINIHKENREAVAVVRVDSKAKRTSENHNFDSGKTAANKAVSNFEDGVVKVSTKSYVNLKNKTTENKLEPSPTFEDGTARIYVKSNSEKVTNNSDKSRRSTAPDSAYVSNPTSPAFEFDLKAANLTEEPEMVVHHSTMQHDTGPPGMYKAERRVKSSYSTKASGQPEKKMESETKESYEWHGSDGRGVTVATGQGGLPQQAIQSSSTHQQALLNEGRAPNAIPLQAVEVDIGNKNVHTHPDASVKHMQSLFETQNYSKGQDFMSRPNATSSMQRTDLRRTGDADVNFQKVPTISSGYERRAFEDVHDSHARPSEPVGTFQNLQSLRTNYEYPSSNQHGTRGTESIPTQNMKMSTMEINTGQRDSRPKKRRKKHVTNVSVEGYQSEGGYASSSDAGSMLHTRQTVSPYPGLHRSTTPTVAGQTLLPGGSMSRNTQDVNTNAVNTERVITPHLREATEENGEYHIKLDLNTNMQQALRSAVAQNTESMSREEMMRNEQYRTTAGTNQYATTGSTGTGIAGQTIEGYSTNTVASGYNTYGGSRGPTPTAGVNGKTDFLMNVNQTMTLDYVPRGNTPVPQGKNISNIHLENEHRKTVLSDDHYAVKSLSRTQHIPDDRRYVETLQVQENRQAPQINVERGNYLIKNSIDTTSAPKVVDIVEDNYSEGEVNIEDNTNMFDGLYYQSKLNPMYSSDQDLRNQDLYRDDVDNRRTTTVRTVKTVRDVPREEVVDFNSNVKYRAPKHHDTTSSWTYHQQRQPSESSSMESVEYEQQQRNANYGRQYSREERMDTLDNDDSMYEEGFNEQWDETKKWRVPAASKSSSSARRMKKTSVSEFDFNRLLRDAPADSVKQSINVEREEEEIIGPLPLSHADGSSSNTDGMLNFDAISEKVDLGMKDGAAQLAVKVRCERVVPVYGQEEVYKKSSVIVTRLIEIDMEVNEERMRLYENIMRGGSKQGMIEYGPGGSKYVSGRSRKLTSKETFNLYKTFMGMAEEQDGMQQQQMHIERKVEDGAHSADLAMDSDLDFRRLAARKVKSPESDTISYMSATEQPDILY